MRFDPYHNPYREPPPPQRAADFDEQFWPHSLVLFALVCAIGLSITNVTLTVGSFENPFHDPYPLWNSWVHYGCLAVAVFVWLVFTALMSKKREHRRMQLAVLLTLGAVYGLGVALGAVPPPTLPIDVTPVLGVAAVALAPVLAYRLAGRYPGMHAVLVFGGAMVGGAVAWNDLRGVEAIGGAVAGALAAHLFGGVVLGLLGALAITFEDSDNEAPRLPRPLSCLVRVTGVAVLVVVLHESYWSLNACAIATAKDVGTRICQVAKTDATPESLQGELQKHRGQLAICSSPPLRWIVRKDIAAATQQTLSVIDNPQRTTDHLDELGRQIRDQSQRQFNACLARPLLLRRVLAAMLAPARPEARS